MSIKIKILIIEDDRNISNFISHSLNAHDYKTIQAFTGKDGISLINSQCPDVILLNLGLPDTDGLEIISNVRKWSSIPIIVVSVRTNEQEVVDALDMGADDYINKPFGIRELLARIRTSLRHSNKLNNDAQLFSRPYISGELYIDFSRRKVLLNNKSIHLTPVEYKILSFLATNSGKVVTHTELMTHVWGPYSDTTNNKILRVNMVNIRRKIEVNPAKPKYIFTEIGVGYRIKEDNQVSFY